MRFSSAALGAVDTQLTRVANVQKYICDIYIIRYRFLKTRLSFFFLVIIHRRSRCRAKCRRGTLHSLTGISPFSRETSFRFVVLHFVFIFCPASVTRDRRAERKLSGITEILDTGD